MFVDIVNRHKNTPIVFLLIGFVFVSLRQSKTTINSTLAQHTHSSIFASLISFSVGTIAFILTLVFNRSLKISSTHKTLGKIKSIYFIGGILGMAFVTSNIILMPFLEQL